MPNWKINCLKSEDGINPSTITDETNKTELISLSAEQQNTGKCLNIFLYI